MAGYSFFLLIIIAVLVLLAADVEGKRNRTRKAVSSTRSLNNRGRYNSTARTNRRTSISTTVDDDFGLDLLDLDDDLNSLQPMMTSRRRPPMGQLDDYEDLLFDDYDGENMDLSNLFPSTNKYLQSEVCGRKFVCRRGDRGPCHRNEMFVPQSKAPSAKKASCSNFITSPWNGCMPVEKFRNERTPNAPTGCCSLRFPKKPCFGYPPTYRFSRPSKRCYPLSNGNGWSGSGPCAPNKVFVDADGMNGMCRCRDRNQLLWKTDDRCYRVFSKGPCGEGEWLEPESNGYGVCRLSPCPASRIDGRHIYWNPLPMALDSGVESGCYKSFTKGPCQGNSYFLIDDFITKSARCVSRYQPRYNSKPARFPYAMWNQNPRKRMNPWSSFGNPYARDYDDDGLFDDWDVTF